MILTLTHQQQAGFENVLTGFDIISLFAADLEDPKIGISGKGLMFSTLPKTVYLCCMQNSHLQTLSIWRGLEIVT